MKKYILTHDHRFGHDTTIFKSESTLDELTDNIQKVVQALRIDFEPDRDEEILIKQIADDKLKIVIL